MEDNGKIGIHYRSCNRWCIIWVMSVNWNGCFFCIFSKRLFTFTFFENRVMLPPRRCQNARPLPFENRWLWIAWLRDVHPRARYHVHRQYSTNLHPKTGEDYSGCSESKEKGLNIYKGYNNTAFALQKLQDFDVHGKIATAAGWGR